MKAFKGLGGTYAMFRILCRALGLDPGKVDFSEFQKADVREKTAKYTFVTATDGNHGKGVSWASRLFGAHAYVYMPKGTVKAREEAVRQAGPAEVTVTDWNYDDTVNYAKKMSEEHGWFLIQDTSWDGCEEIPGWIMDGILPWRRRRRSRSRQRERFRPMCFCRQASAPWRGCRGISCKPLRGEGTEDHDRGTGRGGLYFQIRGSGGTLLGGRSAGDHHGGIKLRNTV